MSSYYTREAHDNYNDIELMSINSTDVNIGNGNDNDLSFASSELAEPVTRIICAIGPNHIVAYIINALAFSLFASWIWMYCNYHNRDYFLMGILAMAYMMVNIIISLTMIRSIPVDHV